MKRRLGIACLVALLATTSCRKHSSLPAAAEEGRVAVERALDTDHAALEERGAHAWTALHAAANRGDADVVLLLLSRGAQASARGDDGATPLHLAARRGHAAVVFLLARTHAELETRSGPTDRTPLHDAVQTGDRETVETLLRAGADANAKDSFGRTALHFAATSDTFRTSFVTPALLAAGADPLVHDRRGFSALHAAAQANNATLASLLLEKAPDTLEVPAVDGETPLTVALRYRSDNVAELLLRSGAKLPDGPFVWPPTHEAAKTDDIPRLVAVLAFGADPTRVVHGKTALELARETGCRRAEELLSTWSKP